MKKLLLFIPLFSLLFTINIFSQNWSANFIVNPYPSPYINDWETNPSNLGSLVILNNSQLGESVRLKVILTYSKYGQVLTSISENIKVAAKSSKTISSTNLISFNNISFPEKSLRTKVVESGRLPEGNYTICVRVENESGNILLTQACGNFTILYPEPPHLIFPANNSSVQNTNQPMFQWTPVNVPPNYQIKYILKVVEVFPHQTFSQALNANYPHYLNENLSLSNFNYPLDALPLEKSKVYAYQVQVLDQFGLPPTQNQGKSEIFTFKLKDNSPVVTTIKTEPKVPVESIFNKSSITGTLHYSFPEDAAYGWPIKNANIKLIKKYVMKVKSGSGNSFSNSPSGSWAALPKNYFDQYKDNDELIKTGVTNNDGKFSFVFDNNIKYGKKVLTDAKVLFSHYEQFNYLVGDVYLFLRIVIEAPHASYYTSPENNIEIEPGESKTYSLFTNVRSYKLNVKVVPSKAENQILHQPIPQMVVYLIRKARPSLVPNNECRPRPSVPEFYFNREVVAKGITGEDGIVSFDKLIRNVGPNDKYYLYTKSDSLLGSYNYSNALPDEYAFNNSDDKSIYSNEYRYPVINIDLTASPQRPSIWGRVKRSDVGQPLENAKVLLTKNFWDVEDVRYTKANGYFDRFNNLPVEIDKGGMTIGPQRHLIYSKDGYLQTGLDILGAGNNGALTFGERYQNFELALTPASTVKGRVVNEENKGILAKVRIDGGEEDNTYGIGMGYFNFRAEAIANRKLIISPADNIYFPDTIFIDVKTPNMDLGNIIVYKKLHRIRLNIVDKSNNYIYGASVRLKVNNEWIVENTKKNGYVEFTFSNDASSFPLEVHSPSNMNFKSVYTTLYNKSTKKQIPTFITLQQASFIAGKITVGKNAIPVEGARIFIENGGHPIQTVSDAFGNYKLQNVPLNSTQKVWGTKNSKDTTFIGDSVVVYAGVNGVQNANISLTIFEGMDITQLLGFPVEVKSLNDVNGSIFISGVFTKLIDNQHFRLTDNKIISFDSLRIIPGQLKNNRNIPIAQPYNNIITTNINELSVDVFKNFSAKLTDNKIGVQLENNQGRGIFKGKVVVDANAVNTQGRITKFENFNLAVNKNKNISVFTHDGSNPYNLTNGYNILGFDTSAIKFNLIGFSAFSDSSGSYIKDNTITLKTNLLLNIPNTNYLNYQLSIGEVKIHPNNVETINSTKPFQIGMDTWSINAINWTIDNSFVITGGTVKTDPKKDPVEVPIQQLHITPNGLGYKAFNLTTLKLAKHIPLTITGNVVLDYNNDDHWFLYFSKGFNDYCAYLTGLEGMAKDSKIYVEGMSFNSKGLSSMSPWFNQPSIKMFTVGKLTPNTIQAFDNYIEVKGLNFDPVIPNVGQYSSIRYLAKGVNDYDFKLVPFTIGFENKGVYSKFGIDEIQANAQVLNNDGFTAYGTVEEQGKFKFKAWLKHTPGNTSIDLETPFTTNSKIKSFQTLPIGVTSTYLDSITGDMKVVSNDWTNLQFAGNLIGTKGIEPSQRRLNFSVVGEVKATGQSLKIKNVPFPFGNMSWIYEFEQNRLRGELDIDTDLNGMSFSGGANCMIDANGWYIIAGGNLKMPGVGPIKAAALFGDYPTLTDEVRTRFKENSHNHALPSSFNKSVQGFLISGSCAIPVIVPDLDIDVLVASAKFYVNVGADMKVWMHFDESGKEFGMSQLGFLDAGLSLESFTCTQFSARFLGELGFAGMYRTENKSFTVEGCAGFSVKGSVFQNTGALGLCEDPILIDASIDKGFHSNLMFNSKGESSFSFGLGTCSDKESAL